jgi:general secretion pathway protein M
MKEWFNSLDARERKIVISGGVIVLLLSIYFLGWEPVANNIQRLKKSNAENQQALVWMKEKASEVKRLNPGKNDNLQGFEGQSLLGVIDKTAKENKLGSAIKRVQPEGKSKALVRMENAEFNRVIRWMEGLQRQQGIDVVSSVIERQSETGLVNARIIFTVGSEAQ